MASKRLEVIITGKADKAIKALKQTERAAGGLKGKIAGAAKVAAASFLAIGVAATAFGIKSAHTFSTVGAEVSKLQRLTGLAAEDASRLRYAFQQSGIGIDAGGRALGAFSKKLSSSKDGMKDFGFRVRDSSGHVLPMNDLLLKAADRLAGMKDGAEKNAYAMKLFGKGGLEMVKVLGKGSEEFLKLSAEAEKYGLVLSQGNVSAVKKSIKAHRQNEAAMQGLQVQIGIYVLPLLTKLTQFFATKLPVATAFIRRKLVELRPQFRKFGDALADTWRSIQGSAEKAAKALKPITDWVKNFVAQHPAASLKILAGVIGGVLVIAFLAWASSAASAAIATIAATWPVLVVIAAIAALAAGLIYAYHHWDWFRAAVDKTVKFMREKAWPAIKAGAEWVGVRLTAAFRKARDYIVGTLIPALRLAWAWFSIHILPTIKTLVGWLKSDLPVALATAKGAFSRLVATAQAMWSFFVTYLLPVIVNAASVAGTILATGLDNGRAAINKVVDAARRTRDMFGDVIDKVKSLIDWIKKIPSKIPGGGILGSIGSLIGGGKSLVGGGGGKSITGSAPTLGGGGSSRLLGGDTYVLQVSAGAVVTERSLGEIIRAQAVELQNRTGRPWIPAVRNA